MLFTKKSKRMDAPAGNRTRSPRMASGDFTIKPLVLVGFFSKWWNKNTLFYCGGTNPESVFKAENSQEHVAVS